MSHASGKVTFNDGLVLHYEYDGTVDVCRVNLWDTYEEMDSHWRNYDIPIRECECDKDEDVVISTSYAYGFEWEGRACRHCKCITKGIYYNNNEYADDVWVGY